MFGSAKKYRTHKKKQKKKTQSSARWARGSPAGNPRVAHIISSKLTALTFCLTDLPVCLTESERERDLRLERTARKDPQSEGHLLFHQTLKLQDPPDLYTHHTHIHTHTTMDLHTKKQEDHPKLRSCSTINTFYHETQQELARLGQTILSKDGQIAELKARLARHERTTVGPVEGEDLVGPSRSLVGSLCKEIHKLKQKLKDQELDAAQNLDSSKREIQVLQQKLREKEQELESVRQRPEHQKDQEIQHLHSILAERDRTQATKNVLYSSLVAEAEELRVQLGATVRVCQDLLGRLEKEKSRTTNTEHRGSEMMDGSEVAHLNSLVNRLKEENQQLKNRVAYVENLNSRWQKYDVSREEYVRGLCQKLKESTGMAAPGGTALYQQEIGRLNRLLEEKMLECERLSRERDSGSLRDRERIQMLEQQVEAYIEDFKSERADRERAQDKILNLEEGVTRLKLQIHAQHVKEPQPTRRLPISLKKPSRKQTETAEPLLRNSPPESSAKRTIGQSLAQDPTDLMCPRCMAVYDEKNTDEYFNHCTDCAKL
ncbi:TNFAIP3-interacting protein 2 isoform X1 [Astyanax mexicanus]|uniref:TNFAIP3-interacting protein 2 isoform X1 n=1 Tax=Astyanax mexicanus TaxID=7994 RepID=UPI0020CAFABD|nr:TNFAIP3-interacting protein 2 isoform X1 [Astyanax mexicanus]